MSEVKSTKIKVKSKRREKDLDIQDDEDELELSSWGDAEQYAKSNFGETAYHTSRFDNDWN